MPFDSGEKKEKRETADELRRIYVCECGDVRLETKHFRATFSPEEFAAMVSEIVVKKLEKRSLPNNHG
ncbi:MAG TPA: hypothetical protein PKE69_18910 [Pyrinomonadaceae bacterium]|nr:hypothetical protein [Pyrinomonadaceae bacterium]